MSLQCASLAASLTMCMKPRSKNTSRGINDQREIPRATHGKELRLLHLELLN